MEILGRILRHASSLSDDGACLNLSLEVNFLEMMPGGAVTRISFSYNLYGRCFLQEHTQEGEVSRKPCSI